MECSYFGACGSCSLYALDYEAQKTYKQEHIKGLFESLNMPPFEFFASPSEHYRGRSEFRIWKTDDTISYAMEQWIKKARFALRRVRK